MRSAQPQVGSPASAGRPLISWCVECCGDATDLLDQAERGRYTTEAVVFVEGGGTLVQCVDHNEAGGNEVGCGNHPPEGVGQNGTTKTVTLKTSIDRKAGQQDRGDLGGAAPADARGQLGSDEAVSREGVVPHHHVCMWSAPHERSCYSPRFCAGCMLSQPGIEFGLPGVQGFELVPRRIEWLRAKRHGSGRTDGVTGPFASASQGRRWFGRCLQCGNEIVVEGGGHLRERLVFGHDPLGVLFHR